ncbi:hypothetical protein Tco_0216657 [Tanacetum coccineum]
MSKKQNCTAMSSTEAEYMALSARLCTGMWIFEDTALKIYGFIYKPKYRCTATLSQAIAIMATSYNIRETMTSVLARPVDSLSILSKAWFVDVWTPADLELEKKDSVRISALTLSVRREVL